MMETNRTKPPPSPSAIKCFFWAVLWLVMWFWAIVGTFLVVCATLSFFVDLSPVVSMTDFFGKTVQTTEQKIWFLVSNAVLAFIGIGFLMLRRGGYLKDPI